MTDPAVTAAQARILRETYRLCVYEPSGSRILACERLRHAGLMRHSGSIAYRLTAAGRRWVEENQ